MISWTRGKWEVFGDVTVDTSDYKALCEEVFEQELVAVPEAVTFHDATFICDFLSGKIYSADDEKYDPGLLYNTLKTQLDIQVRKIHSVKDLGTVHILHQDKSQRLDIISNWEFLILA